MAENIKEGVITIIESLFENLKSLLAELPFFEDKPVDYENIKQQFDVVIDQMGHLTDKTNMTHVLVQSVINSIHSSRKELKDSVDGLLKKTGDQLGRITATTEAATNKILDEAMKLDNDQNTILDRLDQFAQLASTEETDNCIKEVKQMVMDNQDSVFNIIQHLQFQDITAQQIKGAYALLSDTEKTLLYVSNLLKEFDQGEDAIEIKLPILDKNAFNADAVFANKKNIQNAIDDLFSTGDVSVDIPADQAHTSEQPLEGLGTSSGSDDDDFDIDALFSSNKPATPDTPDTSEDDHANQDDIDKLFS